MSQTKDYDFAAALADYEVKRQAYRAMAQDLRVDNKAALFKALHAAGITQVVVSFDGYGVFNTRTPVLVCVPMPLAAGRMYWNSPPAKPSIGPIAIAGWPRRLTEGHTMPEVIETTVYYLDELSDGAKDNARAWYREGGINYDWYASTFEDFERICELLGITLKTRPVKLYGGGTRQDPRIWFTGFWSQGDGASFEGTYSYAKGATAKIRAYAPQDAKLHGIADTLQSLQQRNFYQIYADISQRGRYCHEYTMSITSERDHPHHPAMTNDAENAQDFVASAGMAPDVATLMGWITEHVPARLPSSGSMPARTALTVPAPAPTTKKRPAPKPALTPDGLPLAYDIVPEPASDSKISEAI